MTCVTYPLHPRNDDVIFYVTDVVLPPLIFGSGLFGCLLLIVLLNCRYLRRDSSVYVYLVAAAVVDLLAIAAALPCFLRDVEALPVGLSHSWEMAYAVWLARALGPVCLHSAAWFTALAAVVCYAGVRFDDESPSRWTRISLSRVAVFVLFLFCALLNFTRLFDSQVIEVSEHCFAPLSLWTVNATQFGLDLTYREIHPVIVSFFGHLLPLSVVLLFALLIGCHENGGRRLLLGRGPAAAIFLRTPADRDGRHVQLNVSVFCVSVAFLLLESASAADSVVAAFFEVSSASVDQGQGQGLTNHFRSVARCSSLLRCAVNFVLLALFSHDFRKTFRRNLCCLCPPPKDDEYFEASTCCSSCCCWCCRRRQGDEKDAADAGGRERILRQLQQHQLHLGEDGQRKDDLNGIHVQRMKSGTRPTPEDLNGFWI